MCRTRSFHKTLRHDRTFFVFAQPDVVHSHNQHKLLHNKSQVNHSTYHSWPPRNKVNPRRIYTEYIQDCQRTFCMDSIWTKRTGKMTIKQKKKKKIGSFLRNDVFYLQIRSKAYTIYIWLLFFCLSHGTAQLRFTESTAV